MHELELGMDGNCFGHHEDDERACRRCQLEKDCRRERRRKEKAEKDKDRWVAKELIKIAKKLKIEYSSIGENDSCRDEESGKLASLNYSI